MTRLRLVQGDGTSPSPAVEGVRTCIEYHGAAGLGLTTFRYLITADACVVVTLPAALCTPYVRATMWELFEAVEEVAE